ncbi:DNA-directed RNA polymerase subunit M/transcription elongation factor TFIIS [Paenibacillus amylolyticus]|uniref:DNA-directed RNA polymerase subunit M/transcription elongation factor TFIIS n=1 Tax=Paenibacillus amylolyticus TaxID=1451 RepID=A0AAP5H6Q0_PAEAM|nr:DNA-directed RNA polymerase subunit M/transcription elongation factor TFIIS [Paenibacillus amylolyticus]
MLLECPDCKSTEVDYAGYEVLQEQNGDIADVIELVICTKCKGVFPSYDLREK